MTQRLVAESRSARIEICCHPYEGMGSCVRGLGGSRTLLVPSGTNGGRLRERAGAAAPDAMVDSVADVLRGSVHLKELLEHCATHLGHRQVATRVEIVGTPPDVVTDCDDLWLSLGVDDFAGSSVCALALQQTRTYSSILVPDELLRRRPAVTARKGCCGSARA
jgi:hypothetical protein